MNTANYKSIKDFRKSVDIKQKIKHGTKDIKKVLSPKNFVYWIPNLSPTLIKEVINNEYGNRTVTIITNEYKTLFKQRSHANFKPPKVIPRYINPLVEKFNKLE